MDNTPRTLTKRKPTGSKARLSASEGVPCPIRDANVKFAPPGPIPGNRNRSPPELRQKSDHRAPQSDRPSKPGSNGPTAQACGLHHPHASFASSKTSEKTMDLGIRGKKAVVCASSRGL